MDVTGHGEPAVDLLWPGPYGYWFWTLCFNHGDQRITKGRAIRLEKNWFVTRLKVLLQSGKLHLLRSPESETLAQELRDYEVTVQPDANERYGAFRVGTQDDLVTALGLAVQVEPGTSHFGQAGFGEGQHPPSSRPCAGRERDCVLR